MMTGLRALPHDQLPEWQRSQGSADLLRFQDLALASFLERARIPTRRDRHHDQVVVGLVSGAARAEPAWRKINFLPSVARSNRRSLLLSMEYFRRHHGGPLGLRYGVITSGVRVPVGCDLRGRLGELHRTVSDWAHDARRLFGIEVLLRVTESTTAPDGSQHPHANVVYRPTRILTRSDWDRFLVWSRQQLGAHWRDSGRIRDLREVIKYITKPEDLLTCEDPSAVVPWFYRESEGMHLVQPMGAFREMRSHHKEHRLSVRRIVGRDGEPVLCLVEGSPAASEEDQEDKPDRPERRENLVCGLPSLPCPALAPIAEPIIRVLGYTENPSTPEGRVGLARIRALQAFWRDKFVEVVGDPVAVLEAAGAALTVHNSTTTAPGFPPSPSPENQMAGVCVDAGGLRAPLARSPRRRKPTAV